MLHQSENANCRAVGLEVAIDLKNDFKIALSNLAQPSSTCLLRSLPKQKAQLTSVEVTPARVAPLARLIFMRETGKRRFATTCSTKRETCGEISVGTFQSIRCHCLADCWQSEAASVLQCMTFLIASFQCCYFHLDICLLMMTGRLANNAIHMTMSLEV